ncbi:PRIPO protein, partial [Nothoprocta pentlandii]|nr:PRIPO protein [Nothoprocta pentlandii]
MKRKWEERLKKVEELASYYERNPLLPVYRPKLSKPFQPSPVWKIFCRQAEAFHYVKTCEEVNSLSCEVLVLQSMCHVYYEKLLLLCSLSKDYKTSLMHCYEVIPEKDACKLYFDLEFYKPANPGADGKSMVAKLIELVNKKLEEIYDVKCSAKDVLNLDSSTNEKFSRHLIFLPHKTVFKNNIHVGNFVRSVLQPAVALLEREAAGLTPEGRASRLCQSSAPTPGAQGSLISPSAAEDASKSCPSIAHETTERGMSQQGENSEYAFLLVNDKEGRKQLFVDLGKFYTKNRNFRMYKSSKAGKNVILKIAEDNKFVPTCEKNISPEEAYFLSSLVCNVGMHKNNTRGFVSLTESIEGYQESPYPEIDSFVRSLVNKDGVQGGIRQWNYFSLEEIIVYDIFGYRWCENIGRAHKSNNIMILVDLKKEVWYQKCHDPVCREQNFRSQSFPLPPRICLPFLFQEEEEYAVMDENENKGHSDSTEVPKSSVFQENCASRDLLQSDSVWEQASDDAWFLEATDDVELAEAMRDSLNGDPQEIPDEVLLEAVRK